MEVYNDRFKGGCCVDPDFETDQKRVANGPKKFLGFVAAKQTKSVCFVVLINNELFHNAYSETNNYFERSALLLDAQNAYRTFLQFILNSIKQAFAMLGISFFVHQQTI